MSARAPSPPFFGLGNQKRVLGNAINACLPPTRFGWGYVASGDPSTAEGHKLDPNRAKLAQQSPITGKKWAKGGQKAVHTWLEWILSTDSHRTPLAPIAERSSTVFSDFEPFFASLGSGLIPSRIRYKPKGTLVRTARRTAHGHLSK